MPSFWDVKRELTKPTKPAAGPDGDAVTWSVSDLSKRINAALRGGLPGEVLVRGEIGKWSRYGSSGHCYFSLKDADATVDAKMWKSAAASLAFEPREGQEVIVSGRVELYAPRGQLSLIATRIEPVGQGAMELAFRQLVEKLRGEGLFDPARKRPLPRFPTRICIVTSPKAAGYQDVLKVLRRFPHLQLALYPVPVQGEGAAAKVAAALRDVARRHADFDALLLCRGGGSAEDLWCFNEEIVARALAEVPMATITGIGHETDRCVADFVADHMAHTPTEAAQTLVAAWRIVPDRLEQLGVVLRREARLATRSRRELLANVQRHEVFRRPTDLVDRLRQRVDDRGQTLALALQRLAKVARGRINAAAARLAVLHPLHRVRLQRGQLDALSARLDAAARQGSRDGRRRVEASALALPRAARAQTRTASERLASRRAALLRHDPLVRVAAEARTVESLARRLTTAGESSLSRRRLAAEALRRQLAALDPTAVLGRGYTITLRRRDGGLVTGPGDVRAGELLVTRTAGGEVRSTVGEALQGDLFDDGDA